MGLKSGSGERRRSFGHSLTERAKGTIGRLFRHAKDKGDSPRTPQRRKSIRNFFSPYTAAPEPSSKAPRLSISSLWNTASTAPTFLEEKHESTDTESLEQLYCFLDSEDARSSKGPHLPSFKLSRSPVRPAKNEKPGWTKARSLAKADDLANTFAELCEKVHCQLKEDRLRAEKAHYESESESESASSCTDDSCGSITSDLRQYLPIKVNSFKSGGSVRQIENTKRGRIEKEETVEGEDATKAQYEGDIDQALHPDKQLRRASATRRKRSNAISGPRSSIDARITKLTQLNQDLDGRSDETIQRIKTRAMDIFTASDYKNIFYPPVPSPAPSNATHHSPLPLRPRPEVFEDLGNQSPGVKITTTELNSSDEGVSFSEHETLEYEDEAGKIHSIEPGATREEVPNKRDGDLHLSVRDFEEYELLTRQNQSQLMDVQVPEMKSEDYSSPGLDFENHELLSRHSESEPTEVRVLEKEAGDTHLPILDFEDHELLNRQPHSQDHRSSILDFADFELPSPSQLVRPPSPPLTLEGIDPESDSDTKPVDRKAPFADTDVFEGFQRMGLSPAINQLYLMRACERASEEHPPFAPIINSGCLHGNVELNNSTSTLCDDSLLGGELTRIATQAERHLPFPGPNLERASTTGTGRKADPVKSILSRRNTQGNIREKADLQESEGKLRKVRWGDGESSKTYAGELFGERSGNRTFSDELRYTHLYLTTFEKNEQLQKSQAREKSWWRALSARKPNKENKQGTEVGRSSMETKSDAPAGGENKFGSNVEMPFSDFTIFGAV